MKNSSSKGKEFSAFIQSKKCFFTAVATITVINKKSFLPMSKEVSVAIGLLMPPISEFVVVSIPTEFSSSEIETNNYF